MARVGRPFNAQLTALVADWSGRPVPGVQVTFRVTSGAAAFAHGARTATSTTGPTGVATSQVLAAGAVTGSVRVSAAAGMASRPVSYTLQVLPEPGRRAVGPRHGPKQA